jgi:hypothetical protein
VDYLGLTAAVDSARWFRSRVPLTTFLPRVPFTNGQDATAHPFLVWKVFVERTRFAERENILEFSPGVPFLAAWRVGNLFKVWCPYCVALHEHSPSSGPRTAHCTRSDSPYNDTGYFIIEVRDDIPLPKLPVAARAAALFWKENP